VNDTTSIVLLNFLIVYLLFVTFILSDPIRIYTESIFGMWSTNCFNSDNTKGFLVLLYSFINFFTSD
jgi:hypothetical protein